ncbi:MAG: hypothetical protein M0P27_04740 [Bacteroidales bacterium]|nr:hypothetical protein [Bacteroidales bacterium]
MKKILTAILLLLLFSINSSATPANQETIDLKLLNTASRIGYTSSRLQENYDDLISVIKTLENFDDMYVLSGVSKNILGVYYICYYEKDLLATYILIDKKFMNGYLKLGSERLKTSISRIQSHLKSIQKLYPYVTSNSALHVIDKSRDNIKTVLILLEKCNKDLLAELN